MVFLIATALACLFAVQLHFTAAATGHELGWGLSFYFAFGDLYEWALLSVPIFWLCRRLPFDSRSWAKSLVAHLVGAAVMSAIHAVMCAWGELLLNYFIGREQAFGPILIRILANRTNFNLAVYAGMVGSWYAWTHHHHSRERERQLGELAGHLTRTQLDVLRMQLNPHFLFNTLNTISSLMLTDVETANKVISRFGNLLRATLETNEHREIPLQQEVDFLRRYLEIEQMRFGGRLGVKIELAPGTLDARVPNLILQPLVENAIRHAVEHNVNGGRIEIRSTLNGDRLQVEISDDGATAPPAPIAADHSGSRRRIGVGLQNTRRRLQTLYGEKQAFRLLERPAGGVVASITIPFRAAPTMAEVSA
jgi:two-component system LytT family sensor kinase